MKGWHKDAVNHALLPAWVILERITAERRDLYLQVQPLGDNAPISIELFEVEDLVPTENKIKW